jgi:hypothetical protein
VLICAETETEVEEVTKMASRITINVEKMLDRGPEYGFLEVQVNFEEKASPVKGMSFASVIVPLAKAEAGSMSFDEIRSMALSKAISFMDDCIKGSGIC